MFIALAGISARGEDFAGHYFLRGVMEVGSELLLKSDGNFEYMLSYGASDYWAKGTWRHESDSIILNSVGKKEAPFRLLRSEAGKIAGIRIWVTSKNGKGVEDVQVAVQTGDQHLEATTTSDGSALFSNIASARAVEFEVPVYAVKAGPFQIDSSKNEFYFEIDGDSIARVFFKEEPLAIDGKTLVMRYWNAEQPIRYEKQ